RDLFALQGERAHLDVGEHADDAGERLQVVHVRLDEAATVAQDRVVREGAGPAEVVLGEHGELRQEVERHGQVEVRLADEERRSAARQGRSAVVPDAPDLFEGLGHVGGEEANVRIAADLPAHGKRMKEIDEDDVSEESAQLV